MLLTLPDILSADNLHEARRLLGDAPWTDGRESAGPQARAVKNNQQLPHDCEAATRIRQLVLDGLNRSALFFSAALPLRIFTPRINRYGGEHNTYGNHIDNAVRLKATAVGTEYVRTDVSCTVFLNDPEASSCPPAMRCSTLAPACTRSRRSRAARGWRVSSGYRAWCAATNSAACSTTST
jgi:PKHD-type hydroxylase